jgi:hypothetical protein
MTETPTDTSRERSRVRTQIRVLRVFLLFEVLGWLGLLLIPLATRGIPAQWSAVLPDGWTPRRVNLAILGFSSFAIVLGLASAAMLFLRHGVFSPFAASRLINNLQRREDLATQTSTIEENTNEIPKSDYSNLDSRIDSLEYSVEILKNEYKPNTISRLELEIDAQGNRANLNLIIGGLTAFFSLIFLIWLMIDSSHELSDAIRGSQNPHIGNTLQTYLYLGPLASKLFMSSTAAFFAFFFLSTYRRNLAEIRYFHNELTNVESRIEAVKLCGTDAESLTAKLEILKSMGSTERNFILKRGESTTDLVQKDMDRQEMSALIEAVLKAVRKQDASKS